MVRELGMWLLGWGQGAPGACNPWLTQPAHVGRASWPQRQAPAPPLEVGCSQLLPGLPRPSAEFYMACGIGGILSCGITHTMVTPLDVVKCNMQVRRAGLPPWAVASIAADSWRI